MPGLWRVWVEHRQLAFRVWERCSHRRHLAHQAGKGVLEVVFEQAMKAQGCFLGKKKGFSAAVLLDLFNYYEYVDRELLEGQGPGDQFLGLASSTSLQSVSGAEDSFYACFCVTCCVP
eukprot:8086775-Pyramimonas_sp.AAC.1